jgi:hypothetical protein
VMGIEVSDVGKLTVDSATLAELKALAAEGEAELAASDPPERAIKVGPPAGDREIEALLTGLMGAVYAEARRSFEMARSMSAAGAMVGLRDLHVTQGAKLCNALSMLTVALARHRGKAQRLVIEHFVHRGR